MGAEEGASTVCEPWERAGDVRRRQGPVLVSKEEEGPGMVRFDPILGPATCGVDMEVPVSRK
jgi:hypothetical protein